jgi:hypothetical protein
MLVVSILAVSMLIQALCSMLVVSMLVVSMIFQDLVNLISQHTISDCSHTLCKPNPMFFRHHTIINNLLQSTTGYFR